MGQESWYAAMPLARTLGIELVAAAQEEVRARLAWREELCTAGGVLHGGALMTLADCAGATCAFLDLPEGRSTTTIEAKTSFLRAVRDGHVEAAARALHTGRSIIVIETGLLDADGRLVARSGQTQAIL